MTAYKEVHLECNYRSCYKPFKPAPELGYPPLSVVRREARKAGWTVVRSSLGRRFDKDYCPDHPEGREITPASPAPGEERGDA